MPIYDFECQDGSCGIIFEAIAGVDEMVECPKCGFSCKRLISVPGVNCFNQDAAWIKSVTEVVDKDSPKPETREFLKNPTRDNYHAWMRAEGIRPFEQGERTRPEKPNMETVYRDVWRKYRDRQRISI
jgi:putative FmdB family regulatory protein